MAEAKVPDDARNWNSLDIYVFCNGQQYTPPRKFHLQSDKLKFWESTLKFLARSQYGSRHSTINLYSIEGKKVEGPLELTNDAAYVAVAPHDCFIHSGYDKYLLKASRSREKRQEKRINNNNTNQDDNAFGIVTINVNNMQKETANLVTDANKIKGKSNVTIKNVLPTRPTSNRSPLTKSPIERRKINSKNTILRKINNCGKIVNASQSFKGKDTAAKGVHPVIKETLNYTCQKTIPVANTTLVTAPSHLQRQEIREPEKVTSVHKETSRSNIALDVIVEKDDGDNIIQKTVYQNLESDAVSFFVDADSLSRNGIENLQRNSNISNIGVVATRSSKQEVQNQSKNNKNIDLITKNSNASVNDKQPNTENKECIINLNLNIELKNCDARPNKTRSKFSKCYCVNTEKQSQTNLQINLDKDLDIAKDDNCLSQLNKIKLFIDEDSLGGECKVLIIKCSCSGKNDINNTLNLEKPMEYIILPLPNKQLNSDGQNNEGIWNEKGDSMGVNSKPDDAKEHKVSISICSPTICASKPPKMDTEASSSISTNTQTDWCNTLVEARCNADGSYEFYLPSIEKLKQLNL